MEEIKTYQDSKNMNERRPKVSVIMPMYNQEKYIAECLTSVIRQSLKDIEIIVVNDGSTDSSLKIVQKIKGDDPRVIIIDKKNSGYGHSLNVGVDAAKGEYIGIVETDDYILPEMYETLYRVARAKNAEIVKTDFCRFSSESGFVSRTEVRLSEQKKYYHRVICPFKEKEVFRFPMNTWSGIYRRDFLLRNQIRHNETPGASFQDNGFWFQTFCLAKSVVFLDSIFYMNRRDNPNSSVYDSNKVYCVSEEYKYIDRFLKGNLSLRKEIIGYYWLKKFHNYVFTLNRIAYMFKLEFAEYMQKEFIRGKETKEIDFKIFNDTERECVRLLMREPRAFLQKLNYIISDQPGISVVLVKTNHMFLDTFKSIANQKYGNLQIFCIGDVFTAAEKEYLQKDDRTVIMESKDSMPALLNQVLQQITGKYLHIVPSGAILNACLYSSAMECFDSNDIDIYVFGANIQLSCGNVAYDVFDYNKNFIGEGIVFNHQDAAVIYGCGISLNNKILSVQQIYENKLEFKDYRDNGDSLSFVVEYLLRCRNIYFEKNNCLCLNPLNSQNIDFCSRLEEYRYLNSLHITGQGKIGVLNVIAEDLVQIIRENGTEAFARREDIIRLLNLSNYTREDFFNGYIYDFLLKFAYADSAEISEDCDLTKDYNSQKYLYYGLISAGEWQRFWLQKNGLGNDRFDDDLNSIRNSWSYKVGRIITYFPRKARGLVRKFKKYVKNTIAKKSVKYDAKGLLKLQNAQPLVSVVMPLYNVSAFLKECLNSLLHQTYQNLEIICVDDGSYDNTYEIVEHYQKEHKNIFLYRQNHLYAGVARNTGFAHAKGKYTIFLDADDVFEPDLIRSLLIRSEGTGADISVCACRGFDDKTKKYIDMNWSIHKDCLPLQTVFSGKKLGDYVCWAFMGWAWDKLYRTDFIRKHALKFQDVRSTNDAYFVFTSIALAKRITYVDKILVNQRKNNSESISSSREKSWNNCLLAADKIYEDWNAKGIYQRYERSFCNWFVQFIGWHYKTLNEDCKGKLAGELLKYVEKYRLLNRNEKFYYLEQDFKQFIDIME